jgi:glycosyltransferase involved in cell wall biosynthesis
MMNNSQKSPIPESPLVSIAIPVFNSESTLVAAIESALAQDYRNLEILISDNASTDNTAEICRYYQQRDTRIVFYPQPENFGMHRNFLFLLEKASGEYFRWLGSDDVISTNSISSSLRVLQLSPESVACASPHFFDHELKERKPPTSFQLHGSDFSRIKSFFSAPGRSHGLFYALIKRDILRNYSLLSVDFFASDWCLILYLLSKGPLESAQDTYLVSGSKGLSSSNSIYTHYGLTGWKRILPFWQFTISVIATSTAWSSLGRMYLIHKLILLNFKNLLLEHRILRYKFSALRAKLALFLKKLC